MFNKSKYSTWYNRIIESAKSRVPIESEYYEVHHIIPKCMGGSNTSQNLVRLTAREHYVCHILLIKMVDDKNFNIRLKYALSLMSAISGKQYSYIRRLIKDRMCGENNPRYGKIQSVETREKISTNAKVRYANGQVPSFKGCKHKPETIDAMKIKLSEMMSGKNNPFYGKKHSEKTRQRISQILTGKMVGEANPFYGKKHSEETRRHISEMRSMPIKVIFVDFSELTFKNRKELGPFLGKSCHLGAKLLNPKFKHLWKNYNIKDIILL